jgi:hypothetical protein
MKMIGPALVCFWLLSAGPTPVPADTDTCHVYVIDVKATQQFREKTDLETFMKKSKESRTPLRMQQEWARHTKSLPPKSEKRS